MRPTIQTIQPELIEKILTEAKRVLATVGMAIESAVLRERLLAAGLKLDASGERLLFPTDVVEKAIANAPSSFTLYDRAGRPFTTIGGDKVHFVPGSSGLSMLDHRTNQVRLAKTADFVDYVRLCDGLENIAYLATAFSTNDIEEQVSDAWRLNLCLRHSEKPIVSGAFTAHGVPRMAEMMMLFREGKEDLKKRPFSIFTITATGSFRYGEDSCQNLLDCVELGIPVEIVPVTLMGLIAPVTLVGATVFHTVDVLAGLTMAQLIRPGAPVLFGGAPATFHMQAATSPMVAIEALHLDLAYVAVAKHLNLPTQAYMALSDGKMIDAQAGAESYGSALLAALAGVNSVSGPGMLDYVLVFSLPKLLLDNALCGQALHLTRKMRVVDDLPITELIDTLLAEQHLITAEHTLANWPQQLHLPDPIIDRQNRENWQKQGSSTLPERATAQVEARLAAYTPPTIDPHRIKELDQLVRSGLMEGDTLPEITAVRQATPTIPQPTGRKRRRRRR